MSFTSQYGGNSNGLNINLSDSKPSFSSQFGSPNGTLSEERKEGKGGSDVAGIISASAGGLDSITGFISSITGNGGSSNNGSYYNPPPPPEKKPNLWLIGGIASAVVVLIIIIILTKNGQTKQ